MRTLLKFYVLLIVYCGCITPAEAFTDSPPFTTKELHTLQQYLFNNIASEQNKITKLNNNKQMRALLGAVIASPSAGHKHFSMDYRIHWVRDAAIVMQTVVKLYKQANELEKHELQQYLINYVHFEHQINTIDATTRYSRGEPKFNIDGSVWEGKWARPQNDGPALRAITLMQIHEALSSNENVAKIISDIVQKDLTYIQYAWNQPSYDVWEELLANDHFFAKIIQRKALSLGAEFFTKSKPEFAKSLLQTKQQITNSLHRHWQPAIGYYTESLKSKDYKGGGLNTAVLLGLLLGSTQDLNDDFALDREEVLSTVYFLRNAFANLYKINLKHDDVPLLGRYPHDVYDGNLFTYGNPWVLVNSALAEYYYKLAELYKKRKFITISDNTLLFYQQLDPQLTLQSGRQISQNEDPLLFAKIIDCLYKHGDAYLLVLKKYAACDAKKTCLHFSEQLDRVTGKSVSAPDLTWSYASLVSAMHARHGDNSSQK